MEKKGISKFGDFLSNLTAGQFKNHEYKRQPIPDWDIKKNEYILINNVKIVDVNLGKIREEKGLIIQNERNVEWYPGWCSYLA